MSLSPPVVTFHLHLLLPVSVSSTALHTVCAVPVLSFSVLHLQLVLMSAGLEPRCHCSHLKEALPTLQVLPGIKQAFGSARDSTGPAVMISWCLCMCNATVWSECCEQYWATSNVQIHVGSHGRDEWSELVRPGDGLVCREVGKNGIKQEGCDLI